MVLFSLVGQKNFAFTLVLNYYVKRLAYKKLSHHFVVQSEFVFVWSYDRFAGLSL